MGWLSSAVNPGTSISSYSSNDGARLIARSVGCVTLAIHVSGILLYGQQTQEEGEGGEGSETEDSHVRQTFSCSAGRNHATATKQRLGP